MDRYINDDGYPLPTVLVGPQLAWRLKKTGEKRRGIYKLKPGIKLKINKG